MDSKPQMKLRLFTAIAALSMGVHSSRAEEVSEHLMPTIGGTQISGYVSTTASWLGGQPVFSVGPILPPMAPYTGATIGPSPLLFGAPGLLEAGLVTPPASYPSWPPSPSYLEGSMPVVSEMAPRIHWAPGSSLVGLAAVPEPATMALLGLGAAAMLARHQGRKRRQPHSA